MVVEQVEYSRPQELQVVQEVVLDVMRVPLQV